MDSVRGDDDIGFDAFTPLSKLTTANSSYWLKRTQR